MKYFLTILLTSLFSLNFYAQEKPKKDSDDQVEIIDFGNDEGEYRKGEYKKRIIKTSPGAFIFGAMPFEYEQEMTDFLSLQVGLGLTFNTVAGSLDELYAELDGYDYFDDLGDDGYNDDPYDSEIRSGTLGYRVSASTRLFWGSDGFDGGYIAPVLRYATRNFDVQRIEEGTRDVVRLESIVDSESTRNLDIMVNYGYQNVGDRLTWEYFVGLGLRFQDRTLQNLSQDSSGFLTNGTTDISRSLLQYGGGIRLGYRF